MPPVRRLVAAVAFLREAWAAWQLLKSYAVLSSMVQIHSAIVNMLIGMPPNPTGWSGLSRKSCLLCVRQRLRASFYCHAISEASNLGMAFSKASDHACEPGAALWGWHQHCGIPFCPERWQSAEGEGSGAIQLRHALTMCLHMEVS